MYGRRRKKPKRRGYVRPSRAKPKTGVTLAQLSGLSGVAVRTIRVYMRRGVLPRPPFKGSATRDRRREIIWLLAIRRLRQVERLPLAATRTRLQALPPPELEAFATEGVGPGPLAEALGMAPAVSPASQTSPGFGGVSLERSGLSSSLPRWVRVELALGLELHLRDDASGRVVELARRVREMCAGDGGEGR